MQYKITHMINQSVMGASETWYTPDWSTSQAISYIQQMLQNRMALLPKTTSTVGVRIAAYGAKRQSVALLPPQDIFPGTNFLLRIPTYGSYANETTNVGSDQFRAALQIRCQYNNTRSVIRYLAGIPDGISNVEPATVNFANNPKWKQAYDQWWGQLVNAGFSINAKSITGNNAPATVTGVTTMAAAPSLLGIVLPAATAPPIVQGSQVQLQHFRPAKFTRSPTINGGWTVDSTNSTLTPGSLIVYLRNSSTIDPNTVRITALSTIQLLGYQLYPIQQVAWVRVGIHKRGRPSMAPRGRRLARPTLDP